MKRFYQSISKVFFVLAFSIGLIKGVSAQVPNCATPTAPANGATLTRMATFTWTAPVGGGTPTGYKIFIGTTSAANEILNPSAANNTTATTFNYRFQTNAGGLLPGVTYYWKVVPTNGTGDATGCSVQTFTITAAGDPTVFPLNTWNAYCYNSNAFTNYVGYYTETPSANGGFDSRTSWTSSDQAPSNTVSTGGAATYLGGAMSYDNHSVSYKRQGFTPGYYTLDVIFDDNCWIYLNGSLIYNRNGWTSAYLTSVATVYLDANSQFEFRWSEGGGGSNGHVKFNVGATPPTLVSGVIAGNQSLCSAVSTDPVAFTSTAAASGTCGASATYQWQSDIGCTGTFTDISGATNAVYDAPSGVTQTTCYRRLAVDAGCNRNLASNTITVTVYSTAPGDPTVFPSNSWNGYVYGFASYSSADAGWTDYRGYFSYSGPDPSFNTSTIYTTANVPSSASGYLGCPVTANLSGIQIKRRGFPTGTYSIDFSSDDAGYLYVNGVLVYSRTTNGAATVVWTGNLDATSTVELRYKNNTGAALGALTFNSITTPTLVAGTIAGNQSLCSAVSTDPVAFTSTAAASGSCSAVAYQWQSDIGCTGTFTDISGATSAVYDAPSGVTQTTCYRRLVVDANCNRSLASNTITVTVYSTAPGDPTVFPTNSWNGYVYGFSSYSSADAGWTDYRGYFSYSGSDPNFNTSSIYTTANVPSSAPGYLGCPVTANLSGIQIKRRGFPTGTYSIDFSSDDAGYLYVNGVLAYSRTTAGSVTAVWVGNLDATSTVELRYKNNTTTALGALTFNSIPTPTFNPGIIAGDQILCPGNDPYAFTNTTAVSGSCSPTVAYQWQSDIGCTGTFTNISGATNLTYDVPAGITQTTCYRRVATDANCARTDYTNTVTVTVTSVAQGDPSVFPLNSWNAYVYDFTTPGYGAGGDNNWTDYKGFYSINTVSINTTTLYAATVPPSAAPGYAGCQVTTSALTGAQIKRQGFPTGTYQIDFNSDDAGYLYINGVLIYGRTGCCTLVPNVWTGTLDASSTIEYRYKNNGGAGYGLLTFTTVTPTIELTEGGIALNGPSTICPGNTVTPIVSTSDAASSCYLYYQWQVDSTGTGYIDVTGATSASYTPASLGTSASYRRKVTDACGDVAYSNSVDITVGPSTLPDPSIFGNNNWIAYVYNQPNYVAASLFGSYTDPGVSASDPSFNSNSSWNNLSTPSMASTYTGCQVGIDNHSVSYKRRGFPSGTYTLNVLNDDACQLYIDGVLVYSRGSYTPTFINAVWTGVLGASTQVEFKWSEGGGSSNGAVTFLLVTTPGPLLGGTISNVTSQICSGDVPTVFTSSTLPSNGCAVASYQWQLDNGSGYVDITGATSTTYAPVAQTVSTSYRRQVTDACAQVAYSNVFTISVVTPVLPDPSVFGTNKWNVYAYNDVNFTQLRGMYVDNGLSGTDPSFDSRNKWTIAGTPSNAAGYTGCQTNVDQHGVIYKRQGFPSGKYQLDYNSDDAGSVYINGVLVYSSVSYGTLVTNIWTGVLNSSSTVEYRWADTGGGQSYGQLVMIHPVTPSAIDAGTIANAATTVCSGDSPPPFTSTADASGGCYKSYQWQSSTVSTTAGFSNIVGATSATYTPTAITVKTYYRRKITDACSATANSNVITINVGLPSPPALTWGDGQWNAYVYNGRNFTTLYGSYVESNTSTSNYSFDTRNSWTTTTRPSLATTYSGCQIGDNTFSVSFRQTNFVTGTYQIDLEADDDAVLIINGVTQFTGTGICCTPRINVWTGVLNASSQVEIRYGENNGNAYCKATLTSSTPPALLPGVIGTDQTICSNVVPATLTSVANATSGCAITYQWQRSTTSASGPWTNIGGNTSTLTLTPPGQTQTSYYVRNVTDGCGRSASSNVITVTVDPKPNNAGAITGISSVCLGQSGVTYSISPVTYATSYTWVVPSDATITSGAGTNAITVTFGSTSGDVTVQPVNACGVGLTSTVSVNVTPSIPAAASAISGSATVCQAQFDVLYSVPAVPNAVSYIWTLPAGASFNSGSTTNSPRITFGATSGTITVTPTNSCGNALTATSLAVAVTPTPNAAGNISGSATVCPGQTGISYTIAAVTNATTYNWSLPAGAVITSGAGTRSIVVTFGTTSGNVTVTPTNACGTGTSKSLLVSVISLGTTGAISGPASVCQNSTNIQYTVTAVTAASTYTWTVPPGAIITSGAGTRTIRVTMGTTSGNVTVTPSNSCTTGTVSTRAVAVTNAIPANADPIAGDMNPCQAQSVIYSTTSTGATSYAWTVPSGSTITSGANTNSITVTLGANSGNVTVMPSNVCGSAVASTSQAVVVRKLPAAVGVISGLTTVCKGQTNVAYSIAPVANALTYTWTVPTGAVITSGAGTTSILVSYASVSATSGNVSVDAANTCSTTSGSLTVAVNNACAYTWTGTTSTDWNVGTNWSLGYVPANTNDVIIPSSVVSGNMPSVSSGSSAKSITNNGTISLTGSGVLNVYGDLLNNGIITTVSGSAINMSGSSAQTIANVPSVYNLSINNASGVSLSGSMTLNGTLSLVNGSLTTNNNLTINFDAGGNIGYHATDAGSILGNVSGRRNLVAKTHYISTVFGGVTSGQIDASTPIYRAANKVWLLTYKKYDSQSWNFIKDYVTVLTPESGYSLTMFNAASLTMTGTYTHGAVYSSGSYSNVIPATITKGMYFMMGNPYPSTLDWDNALGWTKTNVDDAIYFWNPATSSVSSYVSGVGTNGATQYIPAMQSFMVKVPGGGGFSSISVNNNARVLTNASYFRSASNQIVRLWVKNATGTSADETVVRMDDLSSLDFDSDADALKIGGALSLYTKTTGGEAEYSINTLPISGPEMLVPLNLKVSVAGLYMIECSAYSIPGYSMILEDKQTQSYTFMDESTIYTFNASNTDSTNRFVLRFRAGITTGVSTTGSVGLNMSTYDNALMLNAWSVQTDNATISVFDASGLQVGKYTGETIVPGVQTKALGNLPGGVYIVKIEIDGAMYIGKIVLK